MKTVQLDIQDDKLSVFLTIINSLKSGIVEEVRMQEDILDIEAIEKDSDDYLILQQSKKENNQKYDIIMDKSTKEWPADFFEKTAGCLADEPIERASQGDYEVRK
ncbi:hypothetical protein QUF74_14550 [Candidatus Halobeggiatoa sp. HSG11]|nr:hypothetical protein [Candidatus Halobeggiatoa sp. HSG11]